MNLPINSSPRASVPPEDRVSFTHKLAYGAGGAVDWFTTGLATGRLWMPVFNIGYGISPGVLGMIMMVYRAWDAFSDPIMGNLSDNTRTRWGRRRPYILLGAVLAALLTPFMWRLDPAWSQTTMVAYITVIGLLLFTCTTIWAMPYNSMMLEMTPNYDERTRVAAYRTVFTKLGIVIGGWVLPFAMSARFADPVTGEPDIVRGVQSISLFIAAAVVLLGTLPALVIRERYYLKEASHQAPEPLVQGLRDTFRIKPLWMMIGFVVFQVFGAGITGALGLYINFYLINRGALSDAAVIEGLKDTTGFLVGLAAVPFWTWVCEKLDKKWTMMIIISSGFIGCALNLVCLTPDHPYLQIVPAVFYASVTASLWLIIPSMLADMVDYDELHTGKRREGSINSVFSWFLKMGLTLSVGLSGFVLEWTGFDRGAGPIQPPEVLQRMLMYYILLPIAFWGIALLLVWRYPLKRARMLEIRRELEQRRGRV
jgi:GPH family glycoside/pentoside/hexuronide:cation symporter